MFQTQDLKNADIVECLKMYQDRSYGLVCEIELENQSIHHIPWMIVVHVIFNLEEVDKQSEVLSKGRMWHPALVTIVVKKIELVVQVKCDKTAH